MIKNITKEKLECFSCSTEQCPQLSSKKIPWYQCENCSSKKDINKIFQHNNISMLDNRQEEKANVTIQNDSKKAPYYQSDQNEPIEFDEVCFEYSMDLEKGVKFMSLSKPKLIPESPYTQASTTDAEDKEQEKITEEESEEEMEELTHGQILKELADRGLVVDFSKEHKRLFRFLHHNVITIDSLTKVQQTEKSDTFHIRNNCGTLKNPPYRYISKQDELRKACRSCFMKQWNVFISDWMQDFEEMPKD